MKKAKAFSKKLIIPIVILFAILGFCAVSFWSRTVYSYIEIGKTAQEQREHDKAIAAYTNVIKLNPWHSDAYYWRCQAYTAKFEYNQAIEDITKAIKLKPDYSYFSWRAMVYNFIGSYDLAIEDYTEVIKQNPTSSYGGHIKYTRRGNVYINIGEYALAIADYDKAIMDIDETIAYRLQHSSKHPSFNNNEELYEWRAELVAFRSTIGQPSIIQQRLRDLKNRSYENRIDMFLDILGAYFGD